MHGAIVIDPPDLAPVAHEYVLVQSELYLGTEGKPGDLAKMQREAHDAVVFNGDVNQYQHHPIRVEPGERVRVWVLDAGPSENSAFHTVGTIFDTVFKEGAYLLRPDSRRGGSQALDLQPSQVGFVEFTLDEAGLYPAVMHKFANVGKGALGCSKPVTSPRRAAATDHVGRALGPRQRAFRPQPAPGRARARTTPPYIDRDSLAWCAANPAPPARHRCTLGPWRGRPSPTTSNVT
jgi:FtsP/CotA-like multicopper oxidase with cupredoxin domain